MSKTAKNVAEIVASLPAEALAMSTKELRSAIAAAGTHQSVEVRDVDDPEWIAIDLDTEQGWVPGGEAREWIAAQDDAERAALLLLCHVPMSGELRA